MSNIYHGLMFLHGHVTDPYLFGGNAAEAGSDAPANASVATRASVSVAPRELADDDACLSC